MHPAVRTQVDGRQEQYSLLAGIDFKGPDAKTETRQEFGPEVDVNKIVQRFGIPQFTRQPYFGDVNFDMTLQDALESVRAGQRLWNTMPPELKDQFPDELSLVQGLQDGTFKTAVEQLDAKKNPKPPAPEPAPKPPA